MCGAASLLGTVQTTLAPLPKAPAAAGGGARWSCGSSGCTTASSSMLVSMITTLEAEEDAVEADGEPPPLADAAEFVEAVVD